MEEITVGDLLIWEPRVSLLAATAGFYGSSAEQQRQTEREVTWAVTVRASAPVLPPLRGGEVVIVPGRTVDDSDVRLGDLLREISVRGATGIVFDRQFEIPADLVPLMAESIPVDFESDINRLLTERRGEIYRSGTELGRALQQSNSLGMDVEHVLKSAADYLQMDATVSGPNVEVIATSAPPADLAISAGFKVPGGIRGWHDDYYGLRLSGGETLWLGPVPPERRALARIVADRLMESVETALAHALEVRPRGSARAIAMSGLLAANGLDASRAAASLGLPTNGAFRVALAPQSGDRLALQRELAIYGAAHDAAEFDGLSATLVELRALSAGGGDRTDKSGSFLGRKPADTGEWMAISGPVAGVGQIPEAARQARFVAALIGSGLVERKIRRFDRVTDIGVYRLIYPLWGSADLDLFASDALGTLLSSDRRGTLRRTLLAYLEAGGSQVEAASRLGVHRNTLSYRLKQIGQLTGAEPTNPEKHLALHMALLASMVPPAT